MKTYIQLDVQNLFFSAKDINRRLDFLKIRDYFLKTSHNVFEMCAYLVRTPDADSNKFESLLRSLGYTLSIKNAIISYGPGDKRIYKGTDQDMAICIDCMKNIDKFDKWVLMSGDGDFIDLCKYLKSKNKAVEVWAMQGVSFNKNFCDYVDTIKFLNREFFYDKHTEKSIEDNL